MNSDDILKGIEDYDLSFVKTKFDIEYPDLSVNSSALLFEMKRWMALCLLYPRRDYVIYGSVDDMWHTFILFTFEYRKFCYTYGEFVHHFPGLPDESKNNKEPNLTGYELFLEDYNEEFGEPNPTIWPTPETIKAHPPCQNGCGGGCRRCKNNCHRSCGRR